MSDPLKIPEGYKGTPEAFALQVAALEPRQCSYPDGRLLDDETGAPCCHEKTREGVCAKHALLTLPRVIREAPERMRGMLIDAYRDTRLTDTRPNLAVADVVLSEKLDRAESGESEQMLQLLIAVNKNVVDAFAELHKAKRNDDRATMAQCLQAIQDGVERQQEILDERLESHYALNALESSNLRVLQAKESAARIAAQEKMMLSYESVVLSIRELCEAFHEAIDATVHDAEVRKAALDEMSRRTYAVAGKTRDFVGRN
jgi:hypothetical protein